MSKDESITPIDYINAVINRIQGEINHYRELIKALQKDIRMQRDIKKILERHK